MKNAFLILVFSCCFVAASAQSQLEGGLFLGFSAYRGDLINHDDIVHNFKEINPAIGGLLRYRFSPNLALRGQILVGKISGSDWNGGSRYELRDRGFSFANSLTEISILGEWDFMGQERFDENGKFLKRINSPYIFAGIGVAWSNPNPNFGQDHPPLLKPSISEDQNTDPSSAHIAVPFGIGLQIDLSQQFSMGLELGFRPVFSDYLDGVSKSGNPNNNDGYAFGGATLAFRFGMEDSDKDGIADYSDACPTVPGLARLEGCPDSDGDGIPDQLDRCPNVIGNSNLSGCPDADNDGVPDSMDKCPNSPGLKSMSGCPDQDGDGITDKLDHCPEVAGFAYDLGCPPADSDDDGIIDREDDCPKVAGPAALKGCPDSDGDRLTDAKDYSPRTPSMLSHAGSPDTPAIDSNILKLSLPSIRFELNSLLIESGNYHIKEENQITLDFIVYVLTKHPGYQLLIKGHTDSNGETAFNQWLSEQRATVCFQYLVNSGVDPSRLNPQGYGETKPVAENETSEGRSKNRRVEFELFLK